jgi:ribosome-associated protein
MMIRINRTLAIPENEVTEKFIQASGPGGQNVNKVATAVQLRFDIDASTVLPNNVKQRLYNLGRNQITTEGVLIIEAKEHRTQDRNRKAARDKFARLLRKALKPPIRRKKTRPTRAAKEKRLKNKKIRGRKKTLRQAPPRPE